MNLNDLKLRTSLAFNELLDRVMRAVQTPEESPSSRPLELEQIEDRVLLSASPVAVVMEPAALDSSADPMATFDSASLSTGQSSVATNSPNATDVDAVIAETDPKAVGQDSPTHREAEVGDLSTTSSDQTVRHELVFVDTGVDDYQQLLDALWSNDDGTREIEVVLLSSQRDGIEQISEALSGRSDLDAVHIVSHGTDGRVKLGGTWLDISNLGGYAGEIAAWGNALSADADLLFYGCDLAASEDGKLLVDSLSALTAADVAASTDDTGHAIFGADWELEYKAGQIETDVAFSQDVQQNWGHLLNVAIDSTSTGTNSGGNLSISHTTSGADRLMLVGVAINEASNEWVTSITYNGDNLSLVGTEENGDAVIEIWSLVNPSLGTHNVDITFSGTTDGNTAGVMTFTGVDPTTPLGTFASNSGSSGGSGSATVSSATGELVFGVISVDDSTNYNLSVGAGQTEEWDLYGFEVSGGGSTEAGAASVDMSWTWSGSDNWAVGGVSIKPTGSVNFQQGVNSYAGNEDTELTSGSPDTAQGNNASITVDLDNGGAETDGLIQFDNIFGSGPNQIPFGSTVNSASL
jgi:hypothetical protein